MQRHTRFRAPIVVVEKQPLDGWSIPATRESRTVRRGPATNRGNARVFQILHLRHVLPRDRLLPFPTSPPPRLPHGPVPQRSPGAQPQPQPKREQLAVASPGARARPGVPARAQAAAGGREAGPGELDAVLPVAASAAAHRRGGGEGGRGG